MGARAVDPVCNWSGPMERGNSNMVVSVLEPGSEGGWDASGGEDPVDVKCVTTDPSSHWSGQLIGGGRVIGVGAPAP